MQSRACGSGAPARPAAVAAAPALSSAARLPAAAPPRALRRPPGARCAQAERRPSDARGGRARAEGLRYGAPDGGDADAALLAALSWTRLLLLEASIDDMSPQMVPHTIQRLLSAGALDAWATPIVMKKGRPALLLTALAQPADRDAMALIILKARCDRRRLSPAAPSLPLAAATAAAACRRLISLARCAAPTLRMK
jgi:hypothetical protein